MIGQVRISNRMFGHIHTDGHASESTKQSRQDDEPAKVLVVISSPTSSTSNALCCTGRPHSSADSEILLVLLCPTSSFSMPWR